MSEQTYFAPSGGMPSQAALVTDRAVFTDAYAVIPKGVMRDIVTSNLPFWEKTRAWVLAALVATVPFSNCNSIASIQSCPFEVASYIEYRTPMSLSAVSCKVPICK